MAIAWISCKMATIAFLSAHTAKWRCFKLIWDVPLSTITQNGMGIESVQQNRLKDVL
jgi:hypothetical protein